MTFAAGTRLGPYEILEAIGAGRFGQVYKGRDLRLDRFVAIKVLAEHLSESPEVKARFERGNWRNSRQKTHRKKTWSEIQASARVLF